MNIVVYCHCGRVGTIFFGGRPWCDLCGPKEEGFAAKCAETWKERGWTPTDTANGMRYLMLALEQSDHGEFCPTWQGGSMSSPLKCDCWKADAAPLIEKWKVAIR